MVKTLDHPAVMGVADRPDGKLRCLTSPLDQILTTECDPGDNLAGVQGLAATGDIPGLGKRQ